MKSEGTRKWELTLTIQASPLFWLLLADKQVFQFVVIIMGSLPLVAITTAFLLILVQWVLSDQ